MDERDQKVNLYLENQQIMKDNVQHGDYNQEYCNTYLKGTKTINSKSSKHKKNTMCNFVW